MGEGIAETFARNHVPCQAGDNSRTLGWQRLRHWLVPAPDGIPWLTIDPGCRYLRRTLPGLISDVVQPEDVNTEGDDHAADALRYGLMSRPSPMRTPLRDQFGPGTIGYLKAKGDRHPGSRYWRKKETLIMFPPPGPRPRPFDPMAVHNRRSGRGLAGWEVHAQTRGRPATHGRRSGSTDARTGAPAPQPAPEPLELPPLTDEQRVAVKGVARRLAHRPQAVHVAVETQPGGLRAVAGRAGEGTQRLRGQHECGLPPGRTKEGAAVVRHRRRAAHAAGAAVRSGARLGAAGRWLDAGAAARLGHQPAPDHPQQPARPRRRERQAHAAVGHPRCARARRLGRHAHRLQQLHQRGRDARPDELRPDGPADHGEGAGVRGVLLVAPLPEGAAHPDDVSQHRLRQVAVDRGRVQRAAPVSRLDASMATRSRPTSAAAASGRRKTTICATCTLAAYDAGSFTRSSACTYVYYYEPTLNPDAFHPKRICELVFIDGIDTEVRHRYCPCQSLDQEGKLTGDSMIGYPIHVLMLRDVPDDNHVPSDSSMTRPLTDELNQYRSQILKSRDAAIPYSFYDQDILPPEKIERITNGEYGPMIPVEGGRLNAANPPVMPGMKPQLSRETYAGQDIIERDLERTLALGSNQTGATNQTRRTATEIATMQSSVDTRLAGEQAKVVEFFCAGVRKLDALVQRYSDQKKTTQMIGDDGSKLWMQWDKTMIAGRFLYTISPDSQIHVDAAPTVSRISRSTTSRRVTRLSTAWSWRVDSRRSGASIPTSWCNSRRRLARRSPTCRCACRPPTSTRGCRSSRSRSRSCSRAGTKSRRDDEQRRHARGPRHRDGVAAR